MKGEKCCNKKKNENKTKTRGERDQTTTKKQNKHGDKTIKQFFFKVRETNDIRFFRVAIEVGNHKLSTLGVKTMPIKMDQKNDSFPCLSMSFLPRLIL